MSDAASHSTVPKFSIVIPVFNRPDELGDALASVLKQSYQNFECIVVDDGSKDPSQIEEVVHRANDPRLRYVYRENGGGGAARNTGIEAALGEFIAFLDSDDTFKANKLEVINKHLPMTENDAVYSQVTVDRGTSKTWPKPDRGIRSNEDMGEYLFVKNKVIQTSSIVLRATTARRIMFNPTLRKGQDLDLCVRLHANGVRFTFIPEELAVWRDITEVGRTSRVGGHSAPESWLKQTEFLLTKRARRGYRATVLSYYLAKEDPTKALRYIVIGALSGVPMSVWLRQCARCFLPRDLYRSCVDKFVATFGKA